MGKPFETRLGLTYSRHGLTYSRHGDAVHAELPPVDGEVHYYVNPLTLGIRTPDALYRFVRGLHGALLADHALFTPPPAATAAWTALLPA